MSLDQADGRMAISEVGELALGYTVLLTDTEATVSDSCGWCKGVPRAETDLSPAGRPWESPAGSLGRLGPVSSNTLFVMQPHAVCYWPVGPHLPQCGRAVPPLFARVCSRDLFIYFTLFFVEKEDWNILNGHLRSTGTASKLSLLYN